MPLKKYVVSAYNYNRFLSLVRENELPLVMCHYVMNHPSLAETDIRPKLRAYTGNLTPSQLIGEFTPYERYWLTRKNDINEEGEF